MSNFLIADNNRLLNNFLTKYLKAKSHNTASLTDYAKVEAWLDQNPCDAIVIDPGKESEDALDIIKSIAEKYPDLKILCFFGIGYSEDFMQAAVQAGADGYISKTLGPSEIYSAICRLMALPKKIAHNRSEGDSNFLGR